jgi:predicted transcriptional regulator
MISKRNAMNNSLPNGHSAMTMQTDFTTTNAPVKLSRLQKRVLTAFLVGPQDCYTVARAITYSDSWTARAIRHLRENGLLSVASVYNMGNIHRCRYTLTRKGFTTAKESLL